MQSDQPLVSILMNCYNGEKYLREAIDSVFAQTYQNWEIIFWDNRSTDRSSIVCNSYSDSRIRYFYAPEHTELGTARRLAFECIKGEFVAILDTDDISHPERLNRQVELLERKPEVALVGSWAQYINERSVVFGEFKPPKNESALHDCLGWTNPIIHSSTMYRYRLAQELGGYSEELIHASDFGLILTLAQKFSIAVIDEFLCQVRVSAGSMSRAVEYKSVAAREALQLFQRAAEILPLSKRALRLNRRSQAIAKIKLGISTAFSGSVRSGLKMITAAFLCAPGALWGNGPVRRFFGKPF